MSKDRTHFTTTDIVADIWSTLYLPSEALNSLHLPGTGFGLPSSFKVGLLAQASLSLSALAASLIHTQRNSLPNIPKVIVSLKHACVEFKSERLYLLNGNRDPDPKSAVGGFFETSDGWVRIHDSFSNHKNGALSLLGLREDASRKEVEGAIKKWKAINLETEAFKNNIVIAALRSFEEWDTTLQAKAISNIPIRIRKIKESNVPRGLKSGNSKPLQGLRVLEFSRVIAAPIAGRTLAAHGADVLWVTSPNLPDLPHLDIDTSRGKRSIQLNLHSPFDKKKCLSLIRSADVLIQGYRPGSLLSTLGLSTEELLKENPNLIVANLSAYGNVGPWAGNRGFDSLVQTCSGINVSEAEHFGDGSPSKVLPCQALDHASGYFLTTGILAALYHRQISSGGSFEVNVSLAGTGKYLRSLGEYEGSSGFECQDYVKYEDIIEITETRKCDFGELRAVRHASGIEGVNVGWDIMPKRLGSDEAVWLES